MTDDKKPTLQISDLKTSFFINDSEVKAVNGVDLTIEKNKTLGLVGESGSGKSITSLSVMQLVQDPGKIVDGKIFFKGEDLLKKSISEVRSLRGNKISMIFQEPMTSLNPVFTVGEQVAESYRLHEKMSRKEAWNRAIGMLKMVGIPAPERRAKQYPYELSGGMRQRIMIAMALACKPELLIADEPTTALDVTIQAQILELMKDLQKEMNMSILLITHDLGVVAEMCDEVAVMYTGKIVERADVETLFESPKHPYTVGLLNSLPRHDIDQDELKVIRGTVPHPEEMPQGCTFAPRCPFASDICRQTMPELNQPKRVNADHPGEVRCWIYSDEWDGDLEVRVNYDTTSVRS